MTDKAWNCYCCMRKTSNFYINKTTGVRQKYCNDCRGKYSASERKMLELKNMYGIIKELNTELNTELNP